MRPLPEAVTEATPGHSEAHRILKELYDERHPGASLPDLGPSALSMRELHIHVHNLLHADANEAGVALPEVSQHTRLVPDHIDHHNALAAYYNEIVQ